MTCSFAKLGKAAMLASEKHHSTAAIWAYRLLRLRTITWPVGLAASVAAAQIAYCFAIGPVVQNSS